MRACVTLILIGVFTTIMTSSFASIPGCRIHGGGLLDCKKMRTNVLRFDRDYAEVEKMKISGTFSRIDIDPRYSQLQHIRLRSFKLVEINFQDFTRFPNLQVLNLGFNRISTIHGYDSLLQLDKLTQLLLMFNELEEFDLTFVPPSINTLLLHKNPIASVNCGALKQLTLLEDFMVSGALTSFDFDCLPAPYE